MLHNVSEINEEGLHISHFRGFMKVDRKSEVVGMVPLDDLAVILVSSRSATISADLLRTIAERDGTTIICDQKFHPSAMVLPYGRHPAGSHRMIAQVTASEPSKKRIWKHIVQQKIFNQARVMQVIGDLTTFRFLSNCAQSVKSGDSDNREAVAAQRYWTALFGKDFRRSDQENPINGPLNYGYAVVRGGAARALAAAGLLPFWGVHHSGRVNPYCLADDIMEPFRPVVDLTVYGLVQDKVHELTPATKKVLADTLLFDLVTDRGTSPVAVAQMDFAQDLAKSFVMKRVSLSNIEFSVEAATEWVRRSATCT